MNMSVKRLNNNESGLVAIMITFIIIIVLAITVLSFAQLARREQRQALDRQLSVQAFYAAESGINDAERALRAGTLTGNKISCTLPSLGDRIVDYDLSAASSQLSGLRTQSEYTCVLVNLENENLLYSSIGQNSAFAEFITPTNITHLRISWQNDQSLGNPFAQSAITFPPLADWRNGGNPINTGVLRVSLTDLNNGAASYNRTNLINNTFTGYFYPTGGAAGNSPGVSFPDNLGLNQGVIVNSQCNTANNSTSYPRYCNVDITGLNGSHYFIRLKSFYRNSAVTVTAFNGPNVVSIRGGQAKVDATGKAADVLRRIQVRLPIRGSFELPENAVEVGDSLCKRLDVAPGYGEVAFVSPIPVSCNP